MYGMLNNNVNNISRPFCGTWGGFKYFVVRLVNGTCCIFMPLCIGCHRLGHIFGRFWTSSSLSDIIIWWTVISIAFTLRVLYVVSLRFRPYELFIGPRHSSELSLRLSCDDNGDINTTTCCTPDVLCVLMFYQRFVGLLTSMSFPWQCVFKLLFLAKVH